MPRQIEGRPSRWKQLEEEYQRPIREIIMWKYAEFENQQKVADALGVSQPTISQWIEKLGLKIVTQSILVDK